MSQWPPQPVAPRRRRKSLLVVAVIAAVLAIVLGGVLGLVTSEGDDAGPSGRGGDPPSTTTESEEPTEPEEPGFRDWLAPSEKLRVGKNPYVSPCQMLTIDDVEEIYGELQPETVVSEEFLDFSVADRSDLPTPYETSCSYTDQLTLHVQQYTYRKGLRDGGLATEAYSLGTDPADLKRKLRSYRAAVKGSDDELVRSFVENLTETARAYLAYQRAYDRDELADLDLDGLVLPVGYQAFEFNFFHDNVAFRLVDETGGEASSLAATSDDLVLQRLTEAAAAVQRIRDHLADPRLSQSPAPTILGDTDRIGRTLVLEPCAVLSPAVFRSITGRRTNQVARRYSLPIDPTSRGRPGEFSGYNNCERTGQQGGLRAGSPHTDMSVRVEIDYAPSKKEFRAALRGGDFLPLDRDDTRLRTRAEWAAEFRVAGFEDPYYAFIVGNYFVLVSITTLDSEGTVTGDIVQGQADRGAHVAAINTVLRSLEKHLERVESQ